MAVACDVTERHRWRCSPRWHARPLDILVNDVGGGTSGIWEAKVEDWDFIIGSTCARPSCAREAAAHMRERRYERIINLSSARASTPWTAYYIGNSAYSAAKASIHGFTRGVALNSPGPA
jgi:NAD(P)-dependent dehydrogenase (short-subunit alcohol dehydrogenase family)